MRPRLIDATLCNDSDIGDHDNYAVAGILQQYRLLQYAIMHASRYIVKAATKRMGAISYLTETRAVLPASGLSLARRKLSSRASRRTRKSFFHFSTCARFSALRPRFLDHTPRCASGRNIAMENPQEAFSRRRQVRQVERSIAGERELTCRVTALSNERCFALAACSRGKPSCRTKEEPPSSLITSFPSRGTIGGISKHAVTPLLSHKRTAPLEGPSPTAVPAALS